MHGKGEYKRAALAFFLTAAVLISVFFLIEWQIVTRTQTQFQFMAANQVNVIKNGMDTALSRAYTFKAMVRENDGDIAFFNREAQEIYRETVEQTGMRLKNVALAPAGVVENVFPLEGNETLLGFDFMDTTKPGNIEALQAYAKGDMVVTNPFELVQGGMGMGARLPVFLERDGGRTFWGLVTVTVDYDELLQAFDLTTLRNMGAVYRLWYPDAAGQPVVLASEGAMPRHVVRYPFAVKNLSWYLDLAPDRGWYNLEVMSFGIAMALLVALLAALMVLDKAHIRRANIQLQNQAYQDGLTACCTRHFVNSILLDQRDGQWKDTTAKYSMAIVDIDNFKDVNDACGHEAGDLALVAVAQVLQRHIKEVDGDCVIRYGGDEFVLLYNNITPARLEKKLRAILEETRRIQIPDRPGLRLTVSIGGVRHGEGQAGGYYEMIRQADKKLYAAKAGGRDRYCL